MARRILQLIVIAVMLVAPLASAGQALAWSNCANYVTVQWGDTLSGIALFCDTTVDAIRAANPGLGWWVYAGQVLYIPTGYTPQPNYPPPASTYVVQWGDTLGKIAARTGTSLSNLLAVNPQIYNPSLIYVGQVINLPAGIGVPPPHNYPPQPRPHDPPQPPLDSYSSLKVDYKYGLYVRSQPGGTIIASALDNTTWYYKSNSVFVDSRWRVWVQVRLSPPVKGCSVGWILVKDQLGTYFTDPPIDG